MGITINYNIYEISDIPKCTIVEDNILTKIGNGPATKYIKRLKEGENAFFYL